MSFPEYPEYKDSGVEWLGEVPAHWAVQRLKWSTASCRNGVWGDEPKGDENDILCIRVADFDRPRMRVSLSKPTYRNVTVNERKGRLVHPGDLLLEKSGGGEKQPVGFVVLYDDGDPAVCSNFVARIELSEGMSPSFWRYVHAAGYAVRLNVPSIKQTSGIQNLDQKSYLDEQGAFPPADEQIRIAAFLDHQTGKIDALIEEQRRLIELLKEKRQAVISHAVTKGLDPNVPMKDSGVEWLGEVPAHWDVVPLGLLARKIQTGPFGSQLHSHEYVEGGVPVINPSSIVDGCIVPDKRSTVGRVVVERLNHHKLVENELVVGRRGEMGRCAVVSCKEAGWLCGTGSMKVSLSERVDPWFLSHFMRIPLVRGLLQLESVGSTMDNLNPELLSRVRVPIPPIAEQRHLVARIEENADQTSRLINEAVKGSELLLERRSSLISAAVTGKIDVRGWSAGAEAEEPELAMVAEESAGYSAQGGAE